VTYPNLHASIVLVCCAASCVHPAAGVAAPGAADSLGPNADSVAALWPARRLPSVSKVFRDYGRDQARIWTRPLHLHGSDLLPVAACGVTLAWLLRLDKPLEDDLVGDTTLEKASLQISKAGSGVVGAGLAAAFYLEGLLADDGHARDCGLVMGRALLDSWTVVLVMKTAANRTRPLDGPGRGKFWNGGSSFPSGHAITAWTAATVVAREYAAHTWVPPVCYAGAAAVAVAGVTSQQHFPSDAFVGSVLGCWIGDFAFRSSRSGTAVGATGWRPALEFGETVAGCGPGPRISWRF
jgi:hypothetical protein